MNLIADSQFEEVVQDSDVIGAVDLGSASVIFIRGNNGLEMIVNTPVGRHLYINNFTVKEVEETLKC